MRLTKEDVGAVFVREDGHKVEMTGWSDAMVEGTFSDGYERDDLGHVWSWTDVRYLQLVARYHDPRDVAAIRAALAAYPDADAMRAALESALEESC